MQQNTIYENLLPCLSEGEFEALKADIAARGVQVPVEYDEHGNILDGHHRVCACQELIERAQESEQNQLLSSGSAVHFLYSST